MNPLPPAPTPEALDALRHQFRRCSESTVQAILDYHRTRDPALVRPILHGLLRRYVPADRREALPDLDQVAPDAPLDALGLDSLSLLEALLDFQDALGISLDEVELRSLRSLGEFEALLRAKLSSPAAG